MVSIRKDFCFKDILQMALIVFKLGFSLSAASNTDTRERGIFKLVSIILWIMVGYD